MNKQTMTFEELVNNARERCSVIKRCTVITEEIITEIEANGGQPIRLEKVGRILQKNKLCTDVEWTDTEDIELKDVKSVVNLSPALYAHWITKDVLEVGVHWRMAARRM